MSKVIDRHQVQQLVQQGAQLLDVLGTKEYESEHIPGAINLPMEKWQGLEGLQKDKTNIVYCYTQTCHLAAKACRLFASRGYPVMEMDGGFKAWKDYELDVEHEEVNRLK